MEGATAKSLRQCKVVSPGRKARVKNRSRCMATYTLDIWLSPAIRKNERNRIRLTCDYMNKRSLRGACPRPHLCYNKPTMPPTTNRSSRLNQSAFYILLGTIVLAPLAFWPSQYFALEAVKTIVIAVGTTVSLLLLIIESVHQKRLSLPPSSMLSIVVLMAVSVMASAASSTHFFKSFFGQGFEFGAGSFILLLMASGLVAFWLVSRRVDRVIVLYAGVVASFLVLYVIHLIRLFVGTGFASFGILGNSTASLVGSWYSLGIYAALVTIVAITAVLFLPLSSRMRAGYWILVILGAALAFLINSSLIWWLLAFTLLGLTVSLWITNPGHAVRGRSGIMKRIAWIPLLVVLLCVVFAWKGTELASPVIQKFKVGYAELSLPWQMTLDVAADELKAEPFLGTGPNRFGQAFLLNKPAGINPTAAWGVEFNVGFGLIPTFVVTQGLIGGILWILFFVFYGILGIRSLRSVFDDAGKGSEVVAPEQPYARFVVVSSFAAATFLWLVAIFYVPTHVMLYYTFVLTGIWLGAGSVYGCFRSSDLSPQPGTRAHKIMPAALIVFAVLVGLWSLTYLKNTVALAYFGSGVKALTVSGDPAAADRKFIRALSMNRVDVYWQARVEATLAMARNAANSVTAGSNASTTEKALTDAAGYVNQAFEHSKKAIDSDTGNYYNYLSAARVAEAASSLRMENGYEAGVEAYGAAIRYNPQNPSLYVSLARFQAANNKLDDAIRTIGAAIQVKSNYLEAVYLLAQVEAAKGNLTDAITASKFAVNLNPENALVRFQLGLLQYTAGDYSGASETLIDTLRIQSDYANAQYFLGLAFARLGRTADAAAQFEQLSASNPDNSEVRLILANLRAGKSPFTGAVAPVTSTPEKRATPPLPEKKAPVKNK